MNTFGDTQFTGKPTGTQPASASGDLTRLQDVVALLAAYAPLSHQHAAGDIIGLGDALVALLAATLTNSQTVTWATVPPSGLAANVVVSASRGLVVLGTGLAVDSGVVSMAGHRHVAADVTDFSAAARVAIEADLVESQSISWVKSDSGIEPNLRLKVGGGLGVDGNGVYVDFGGGAAQAAPGNHTHAQLHNPVTLGTSETVALSLAGQQLAAEVALVAGGGLLGTPSGVEVDFGTAHTQAARGDHTHAQYSGALTVRDTSTLALTLDDSYVLSGVTKLDPAPPGAAAALAVGANGIYLPLGSGINQATPGNHTHANASEVAAGFMSAADKTRLDALVGLGTSRYAYGVTPAQAFEDAGSADAWTVRAVPSGVNLDLVWQYYAQLAARLAGADLSLNLGGALNLPSGVGLVRVGANQVVGARQGAIVSAAALAGTGTNGGYGFASLVQFNTFMSGVNTLVTQFNAVLGALRAHGLIES